MTNDPNDLKVRVNIDLAAWIPEASKHKEAAREFLSYLFQKDVMDKYNAAQLGFGTDDGRRARDRSAHRRHEEVLRRGGVLPGRLAADPADDPGCELPAVDRARQRRREDAVAPWTPTGRAWHCGNRHTSSTREAKRHGNHHGDARRTEVTQGRGSACGQSAPGARSRGSTTSSCCRRLVLFTLAITLPAVIGIFFSFTELDRLRRLAVHRAHQLHRRLQRSGDPAELPVHVRVRGRSPWWSSTWSRSCSRSGLTSRIRFKTGLRDDLRASRW